MKPVVPFDSTMQLLHKVLDLRSSNQKVISSNIANAETPGYSAAKFEFQAQLQEAIGRGQDLQITKSHPAHITPGANHIEQVEGFITRTPDQTGIGDENSVDVNQEMIDLSKNQILYETTAKLYKKKMTVLKYAVSDGR